MYTSAQRHQIPWSYRQLGAAWCGSWEPSLGPLDEQCSWTLCGLPSSSHLRGFRLFRMWGILPTHPVSFWEKVLLCSLGCTWDPLPLSECWDYIIGMRHCASVQVCLILLVAFIIGIACVCSLHVQFPGDEVGIFSLLTGHVARPAFLLHFPPGRQCWDWTLGLWLGL